MDAIERFAGHADLYDRVRPTPPTELTELISQWAGADRPSVIDVGAGTGLSTAIWSGRAARVRAVEPGVRMREIAERRVRSLPDAEIFTVHDAIAERTGLPDNCADVVTVSQAMHWLDPQPTLAEVARLLRPGGVLAVYDCVWPPCVHPEVDEAYAEFQRQGDATETARGITPPHAAKSGHAERMRGSGLFRHVREISIHKRDVGDAARLVDIARSQGGVRALLASGMSEDALGLTRLREVASRHIPTPTTWWWTYEVQLAAL